MKKTILFNFFVDQESNIIKIERSFNAPVDLVWKAWTSPEILDKWWAPKPWTAHTKFMNFSEGGIWLYAMVGPENEKHWARVDYLKIDPQKYFSATDSFCDEEGKPDPSLTATRWEAYFTQQENETILNILLTFSSLPDLKSILSMGFKEGFTSGLENLDQLLDLHFEHEQGGKKGNIGRVSTYLNFQGNTEEAFKFYREVFKSEFINSIKRFGDMPPAAGQPPMPESVKKMVLHLELPITGGHVLMGTDAPLELGMKVKPGNNMHINIEPESKEEAKRIFEELSASGKVEMPLQEMFWGAYFGSFTDRYGINWMINYKIR